MNFSAIAYIVFILSLILVRRRKKTASDSRNDPKRRTPVQMTQSRKDLDRRLSEGRLRQRSDHSQVFGHSDDDRECVNEGSTGKHYTITYVDNGKEPWEMKREKDPWEL